jgi:hypothetical protein
MESALHRFVEEFEVGTEGLVDRGLAALGKIHWSIGLLVYWSIGGKRGSVEKFTWRKISQDPSNESSGRPTNSFGLA